MPYPVMLLGRCVISVSARQVSPLGSAGWLTVGAALLFFVFSASLFSRLGSEFIPELDEGAMAIQIGYPPSKVQRKAGDEWIQPKR